MRSLKRFVKSSKTFESFTFQGCYDMNVDIFVKLYNHYLETGENVLDVYTELHNFPYDLEMSIEYNKSFKIKTTKTEFNKLRRYVGVSRRLKLFDEEANLFILKTIDELQETCKT